MIASLSAYILTALLAAPPCVVNLETGKPMSRGGGPCTELPAALAGVPATPVPQGLPKAVNAATEAPATQAAQTTRVFCWMVLDCHWKNGKVQSCASKPISHCAAPR